MRATTLEMEEKRTQDLQVEMPQIEDNPEHPSREEVELRAYCLWQERGCPEGSPEEDWYRAEAELSRRERATSAPAFPPARLHR